MTKYSLEVFNSYNMQVIKVGIADDHEIFKQGVQIALSVYKDIQFIVEADNGLNLLNELMNIQPDVILLDLRMPVMNGIDALPKIKNLYPSIKVIILSMDMDYSTILKLLEMGANSYLIKNSDPELM